MLFLPTGFFPIASTRVPVSTNFDKFTSEWQALRNSGKWSDYPDYGKANLGYLALQDHGSGVWFKAVKIKSLD